MSNLKPLQIDIVSDVVCPWCYIGKRRIENALALVPDVPVEIRWRAVLSQIRGCPAKASPRRIPHREIRTRPRLTNPLPGALSPRRAKKGCCTGPTWSSASPTPPIAIG